jgi:hypothetical protein
MREKRAAMPEETSKYPKYPSIGELVLVNLWKNTML